MPFGQARVGDSGGAVGIMGIASDYQYHGGAVACSDYLRLLMPEWKFLGQESIRRNFTHEFEVFDCDQADVLDAEAKRQMRGGVGLCLKPCLQFEINNYAESIYRELRRRQSEAYRIQVIDSIHRDKNIPKKEIFKAIEIAVAVAVRSAYPDSEVVVTIDESSGAIDATRDSVPVDTSSLSQVAAQTAKQVIIQKIREAERDSLFDEFEDQRGDLMTGTVQRFEGGAVIV
ncbi:NusA N-terminal domain-containing protein, partial [Paludisphaera sp.]|uniref:NusA N-terminal domain-containing protein n=1 Tax=Paludisphaera sp. TaxID=2017432 RepID=UPI00301CC2E4